MKYLALYRKYRPVSFDEVVGQDKVIKVINNAIINNKVSHAYLLSGPRGTGKTTTAKIIAKMVNCLNLVDGKPCDKCDSCINIYNSSDIVEIDAASNNGVEEIREIRDKVNFVPTSCKYKVYIIDEVHMLTTQAFNALLKTLEEPPSHVIFILATTEIYKIPLTISSRCQKFQFTKISDDVIVNRLKFIAEKEKIEILDDALYEIARFADGGLRDAINLLDQLSAYKNGIITLNDVFDINGSISYLEMSNLLKATIEKNNAFIIDFVNNIDKNGKNILKFIEEIIIFLKDVLLYKTANNVTLISDKNAEIVNVSNLMTEKNIFIFIDEFNNLISKIKISNYSSILLTVTLLKLSMLNTKTNIEENKFELNDNSSNIVSKDVDNLKVGNGEVVKHSVTIDVDARINNTLALAKKSFLKNIKNDWNKISDYLLDDKFSVIVGILADVVPVAASNDHLILECKYEATALRLNEIANELSDFLFNIYNEKYKVVSISTYRWNIEKNKYVNNLKKGIKYFLVGEKEENDNSNLENSTFNKIVSLFGEDIIEYK